MFYSFLLVLTFFTSFFAQVFFFLPRLKAQTKEGCEREREGERKKTNQVRVLELLDHLNVLELDIEILVDALEDAADADVVFELDRDLVVDEGFEEAFYWVLCQFICLQFLGSLCVSVCVCMLNI